MAAVLAVAPLPGVAAAHPRQTAAPPAGAKQPTLPPAAIDDALAIGGDDLHGRKISSRMAVDVRVDGQGPYRFVVDSGADSSVISLRRAQELRLPPGTPAILHGTTSTEVVDRVKVDRLDIGQTTIRDMVMPALSERFIGADGLIGIDALVEQRLMLDFEAHKVKIEDARIPMPRFDGEIVVMARRRHGQLILTQARANGRSVDAVIDTGSEITIGNIALRDQMVSHHSAALTSVAATGVTGVTMNLQIAQVRELRLGTVVLRNITIAFADAPPFALFGLADRPALMLGTDLMETFRRVSLDFRAHKVRFQLRRCRENGVTVNSSSSATLSSIYVQGGGQACTR